MTNVISSRILFVCCVLASYQYVSEALIIPDEVPTLLSLIYSNIPTLKKGTDSRIGWGFRFGDRADFQILVELGPQKDTLPLANQKDNANKRQALNTLANTLYAQSLHNKQNAEEINAKPLKDSSSTSLGFIEQWRDNLNANVKQPAVTESEEPTKFTLGIGEVDAKDFIPADEEVNVKEKSKVAVDPIELLTAMYKNAQEQNKIKKSLSTAVIEDN